MVLGIPGLVMLARFVPPGVREPHFTVEDVGVVAARPPALLVWRGTLGGLVAGAGALALVALLAALKALREKPDAGFDFGGALWLAWHPAGVTDWVQLLALVAFGLAAGLFVAATIAARNRLGNATARGEYDAAPGVQKAGGGLS
jgi:PAT family beta-lactamase induction signal transducer AmpG